MTTQEEEFRIIFRRFRRGKNGELLDAWKYGKKAWPIKVRKDGSQVNE